MTTYDEASGMQFTDVLNRYQALNDRDSMSRAIATLQARGEWNDDRSLNPDDYPPLTISEHLELIALGERLARHFRHPVQVHHAVLAGATWQQIAEAAGGDVHQARQAYQAWAEEQHQLRRDFPGGTIGLGDDEYAAALEVAGERVPAAATGAAAELNARRSAAAATAGDFHAAMAAFQRGGQQPDYATWACRLEQHLNYVLKALGGAGDGGRPS